MAATKRSVSSSGAGRRTAGFPRTKKAAARPGRACSGHCANPAAGLLSTRRGLRTLPKFVHFENLPSLSTKGDVIGKKTRSYNRDQRFQVPKRVEIDAVAYARPVPAAANQASL